MVNILKFLEFLFYKALFIVKLIIDIQNCLVQSFLYILVHYNFKS
jgi:hypothetical protein